MDTDHDRFPDKTMLMVGAHVRPNRSSGSRGLEQITTPPGPDSESVQHSEMNSNLPLEIYSHIIAYIDDKPTLLSLLISSKSVHSQAEWKLYHSVKLERSTSHKLFLESILDAKRPHLARLVHSYSLAHALADGEFNTLLTRVLVTLVNLKYLSFRGLIGIPSGRVLPVGAPYPFQLHTFHWTGGMHIPLLGPFLDAQHSLEVLSLFVEDPFVVSHISLQKLRTLVGSTDVITRVLPGRTNITCLEWIAPSMPVPVVRASLVSSFSHIRILSFVIWDHQPFLGAFVTLLRHLETLELGTIYAREAADLYKLTCLRTLVINNGRRDYGFPMEPQEVFKQMDSLEKIDLGQDGSFLRCLTYKRRGRGAHEPIKVDVSDVIWWSEFLVV